MAYYCTIIHGVECDGCGECREEQEQDETGLSYEDQKKEAEAMYEGK